MERKRIRPKTKYETIRILNQSSNLLKPHHPPLPFVATIAHIEIHRTALASTLLPLFESALSSLSRLPSPPLTKLVFALLAACVSDSGRWSEAYTIDALAVVTERTVDFMACDL
jgi:hypothetical protein